MSFSLSLYFFVSLTLFSQALQCCNPISANWWDCASKQVAAKSDRDIDRQRQKEGERDSLCVSELAIEYAMQCTVELQSRLDINSFIHELKTGNKCATCAHTRCLHMDAYVCARARLFWCIKYESVSVCVSTTHDNIWFGFVCLYKLWLQKFVAPCKGRKANWGNLWRLFRTVQLNLSPNRSLIRLGVFAQT